MQLVNRILGFGVGLLFITRNFTGDFQFPLQKASSFAQIPQILTLEQGINREISSFRAKPSRSMQIPKNRKPRSLKQGNYQGFPPLFRNFTSASKERSR